MIAEWLAGGRNKATSKDLTVSELILDYMRHVAAYYVDGDGRQIAATRTKAPPISVVKSGVSPKAASTRKSPRRRVAA